MLFKLLLTYIIFIFSLSSLLCEDTRAKIIIRAEQSYLGEITPLLYGAFMEFVMDKVNSPTGMYAQEFRNRGFDINAWAEHKVSIFWRKYQKEGVSAKWDMFSGGYNPNGKYYQQIEIENDGGEAGIYQKVYMEEGIPHQFYIYFRGNCKDSPVEIRIYDTLNGNLIFMGELGLPEENWKKRSLTIDGAYSKGHVNVCIIAKGKGRIDFDEASLMPLNNKYGVRAEYYEMYKIWSPGMLRYPGGWIADIAFMSFKKAIGDIDKRNSPNVDNFVFSQRMDFGVLDYLEFCKDLKIEPQITINFGTGTPEEARDWVEFCNGDITTKWGKIRDSLGYPDPYNVKYWEIGNEQYGWWAIGQRTVPKMAEDFLVFHNQMKEVDSSIFTIINGSFWHGKNYFDTVMTIVGKNCGSYGWHYDFPFQDDVVNNDEAGFLSAMGSDLFLNNYTTSVGNWLSDYNFLPEMFQGNTEWYMAYGSTYNWHSHERLYSLEAALWTAVILSEWRNHAHTFKFAERTSNSGMFVHGFDSKTGKRIFAPSPSLWAISMMRHHGGKLAMPVDVECGKYDVPELHTVWNFKNVKFLKADATETKDTLFLTVINKNPWNSIDTDISIGDSLLRTMVKVYQLSSDSYLDSNWADEPYKIIPKEFEFDLQGVFSFPKHSLTILAIPKKLDSININKEKKLSIKATQNPFSESVGIILSNKLESEGVIVIYDVLGKEVFKRTLAPDTQSLYWIASNFPIGSYYVILKTKNESANLHIIKQK